MNEHEKNSHLPKDHKPHAEIRDRNYIGDGINPNSKIPIPSEKIDTPTVKPAKK